MQAANLTEDEIKQYTAKDAPSHTTKRSCVAAEIILLQDTVEQGFPLSWSCTCILRQFDAHITAKTNCMVVLLQSGHVRSLWSVVDLGTGYVSGPTSSQVADAISLYTAKINSDNPQKSLQTSLQKDVGTFTVQASNFLTDVQWLLSAEWQL